MKLFWNNFKFKTGKFFSPVKSFFKKFDFEDFLSFVIALPMIFYGLYLYKQFLAFIVVGGVLLLISMFGSRK